VKTQDLFKSMTLADQEHRFANLFNEVILLQGEAEETEFNSF
jgi:hypothetical protein